MAAKANKGEETLEAVEKRFAGKSEGTYARIMDLNVSQSHVQRDIDNLLNMRHKLLTLYGVAEDPKWSPGGAAGSAGAAEEVSWKQRLNETLCKKTGSAEKGAVTYTTTCVDENAKPAMYVCTLSNATMEQTEYSGAPAISKKQAEQNAAKAAMEAEFPIIFQALNLIAQRGAGAAWKWAKQGQKRKTPQDPASLEGKQKLMHSLQLLLGRSVTKEDQTFDVAEADGKFVATLKLPTFAPGKEFKSAAAASRKEAESEVAEKAVAAYADKLKPLEEAHQEKKKQKREEDIKKRNEKQAERKAAYEAKKAEKQAAAAAAAAK